MHCRPHGGAAGWVLTTAATSKQKLRGTSRDHIIDVSLTIIEDEGVEQLTIRRIAETINRTQPAVYQHFSSKDAILAAVVIEGFTALAEHLKRAPRGGTTSLIAIANAYVRFGLERPRLYEVMFVGQPVIAFAVADTPMPAKTAFQIFATAVGESGLEPAQVDTVTEVVWAALHGLVMLSITKRLRPGRVLQRTRLEQLTAAIVAMIASI
jgi:AcrR family transcriptional regulator